MFPNEEEMTNKSGEQILKRSPMPAAQAPVYKTNLELERHIIKFVEDGVEPWTGRQLGKSIFDEFRMSSDLNHGCRMEQAYTIPFPGDAKMEDFLRR